MTDSSPAPTVSLVPVSDTDRVSHEAGSALSAHNRQFMAPAARVPFVLAARDADCALVGACVCETEWAAAGRGWLHVDTLWVAERHRGAGLGSRLLAAAEAEGARRGCTRVHLDTAEFQARQFYEQRGYRVFGTQRDYPPGSARYFLEKALDPADA